MATVEGLQDLLNALDETSLNLGSKKKLIVKALREGAKPIEVEARQRLRKRSGAAAKSVSTSVIDQTATGAEAHTGPRRFYPKFSEYGTIHQPADPRLGPAYDNKEEEAVDIISKVLGDGIEESYG